MELPCAQEARHQFCTTEAGSSTLAAKVASLYDAIRSESSAIQQVVGTPNTQHAQPCAASCSLRCHAGPLSHSVASTPLAPAALLIIINISGPVQRHAGAFLLTATAVGVLVLLIGGVLELMSILSKASRAALACSQGRLRMQFSKTKERRNRASSLAEPPGDVVPTFAVLGESARRRGHGIVAPSADLVGQALQPVVHRDALVEDEAVAPPERLRLGHLLQVVEDAPLQVVHVLEALLLQQRRGLLAPSAPGGEATGPLRQAMCVPRVACQGLAAAKEVPTECRRCRTWPRACAPWGPGAVSRTLETV
eukprot:scaffold2804_cov371-Prasinococcus_capsulatus_cf.AAC.5